MMLGTNLLEVSSLDPVQRCKDPGNEWKEILNPIRPSHNEHDTERQPHDVLLSLQLSVHGEERLHVTTRTTQQFAVFHARPTHALNCGDIVLRQGFNQVVRKILVKQNAHWSARCRAPFRARQ